jgi:mannosyltransferase OCH1-like enzyme
MRTIPKVFHQIWFGPPMPVLYRRFAEDWARMHPDWQMRLWTETNLPTLRNQHLFDRAAELCPNHIGQLQSDILRLEVLYEYGGVYLDTDFEPKKSIDELLRGIECFAAWVTPGVWINNAFMGAVAGHPFIKRLIDGLPASIKANPGKPPRKVSGPQYLTKMWKQAPDGMFLFDAELFYPYSWDELDRDGEEFPNAYAVHVWNNQRRERNLALPERPERP